MQQQQQQMQQMQMQMQATDTSSCICRLLSTCLLATPPRPVLCLPICMCCTAGRLSEMMIKVLHFQFGAATIDCVCGKAKRGKAKKRSQHAALSSLIVICVICSRDSAGFNIQFVQTFVESVESPSPPPLTLLSNSCCRHVFVYWKIAP